MEFQLGSIVVDTLTRFTGTAIARVEYLNGTVQYGVQAPVDMNGAIPELVYIDAQRLQFA